MPFPHAVELQDADGEVVAVLWSGDDCVELICERGYIAEVEVVRQESPFRLMLRVIRTPDGAIVGCWPSTTQTRACAEPGGKSRVIA
jgi:hypothetical protein